jgi:hypothetical protein
MSFLGALGAGLGGYAQGREEKQQRQAQADALKQQQAEEQQRLALEQQKAQQAQTLFNQEQEDRTRNHGINPATGKPFAVPWQLMEVRPNNGGTGGPITPQDQLNHLQAWARWYLQTGQTDAAAQTNEQLKAAQTELLRQQTEQAALDRELRVRGTLDAHDQYIVDHGGSLQSPAQQGQLSPRDQWLLDHYGTLEPNLAGNGQLTKQASAAESRARDLYNSFDQLYKSLTFVAKNPITGTPYLDPKTHHFATAQLGEVQQQQFAAVKAHLEESADPQKDADAIIKGTKNINPDMAALIQAYAKYVAATKERDKLRGEVDNPGGSNAAWGPQGSW